MQCIMSNFYHLVYAMTPNLSICAGLLLLVQIGILTNKFIFLLFSFSKTLFSSTPFFLLNLKSKMYFLFLFSLSVFTIKIFPPQKKRHEKHIASFLYLYPLNLFYTLIMPFFDENKKKIIHFFDR